MSVIPGWRAFDFFTTITCRVKDEVLRNTTSRDGSWLSAVEVDNGSLHAKKPGHLRHGEIRKDVFWVGMSHGMVHCVEVEYAGIFDHVSCRVVKSFPGLDGLCVGYLERIHDEKTGRTLLVVVGYREEEYSVVLTCWDVSDGDSLEVIPKKVASVSVFKSIKLPDSGMTCMDVGCVAWPRVTIAIGTEYGGVYVYSCGDVTGRKATFLPLPYSPVDALKKKSGAVTNVHMNQATHSGIYGVTEGGMVGFDALKGHVFVEDQVGAAKHCSCVNEYGELAVCGHDGIFYYTVEDGRTVAVSMKGEKRIMMPCGDYMAIVSPLDGSSECMKLVHVRQKIVACSMTATAPLRILHFNQEENLVVYVLDGTGTLHVLSEKSIGKQVDELCTQNLFQQALGMCDRALKEDQGELRARVNLRYGDYSFERRDFESATEAYIDTIGWIETSHAIQKLLSGQQISHLSKYLRALFDNNQITGDHISLLIYSYIKMNSISELDSLVEDLCRKKVNCEFDTEAAIQVLRQTGFTQHALDLARSFGKDHIFVSILLRQRHAYEEVLDYLRSRPRSRAAEELKNNGKILLQNEPVSTTALLMELCIAPPEGSGDDFIADLADFAQIYIDNPQDLRYACEAILAMGAPNSPSRRRLYHTLLDMYLMKMDGEKSELTDIHAEAAMDLLKRGWTSGHEPWYNADDALTSCRLHSFHKGLIFINIMLRRYRDAISTMARIHDWRGIVEVCQMHGCDINQGGDPMVWQDALASLSCPEAIPDGEGHLKKLLDEIDEKNIVPPLTVLSILAKNPDLKFGVVKDYFGRIFESEYECIKEYSKEIDDLSKSLETQQKLLDRVESKPRIFQSTKDSQTGAPLELPLVHFMCGHSFNLRTLSDQEDPKCPLCSEEHERILAMEKSFRAAALDKDSFFRQLHSSDDAFTFIAESFGKGYMHTSDRQSHMS